MGLTATGIGSNLDIEGLISQLMTVEQRPLNLLASKQTSYQTKLSAYSMVQGYVSQFQSTLKNLSSISKYQSVNSSIGNKDIANITVGSSAAQGTYALEVNKLAQSQKLVTQGVASDKTAIGNGKITIDFGTISGGSFSETTGQYTGATFTSSGKGVKEITIDQSNNTLTGIRDAINKADIGVTATIMNVGGSDPSRLVLTSAETGEEYSMKISVDGDEGLSNFLSNDPAGTQNLKETSTAQNAKFTLDGIEFTKSKNSITDAIEGVTIELLKTNTGSPTNISVTRSTAAAADAVNSFVKAYNDLTTALKNLTAYDAEKKSASTLTGDSAVRAIQTQLRSVLSTPLAGGISGYSVLSDAGVSIQKDGLLSVDSAKLQKALAKDFNAFVSLFAEGGTSSNSNVQYVESSAKTKPGTYSVSITQAATQGKSVLSLDSGLDLTEKNTTMQLTLNGVSTSITLDKKAYGTAQELADELQSKINSAGASSGSSVSVKVNADGTFNVESNAYGSVSNVTLMDSDDIFTTDTDRSTEGRDVMGTINGMAATGSGQYLTAAVGSDAEGIKLQVTGSESGYDATVSFSQGYAYQFSKAAESILKSDGVIATRIDGMNTSLKNVAKDQAKIEARLVTIEARYRRQFTSLDILLSKMNQTSSYLTQQLDSLSNLYKK